MEKLAVFAQISSYVVLIVQIYRTENDFLVCGMNLKEARTFIVKAMMSCLPYLLVLSFAVLFF